MLTVNDDYTKPYDDEKMTYEFALHKYKLDLDHAQYHTGINLSLIWNGNDNANLYLEQIRDVVYTFILRYKDSKYYTRMLYYLSHSESAREGLRQIMLDTVTYNYEDGGFKIAYQTGINLHEMKDIDIKIEEAVSVIAEEIMFNYGMKQRFQNINLNTFERFDLLEDLVDHMVDESLITAEQAEDIETLDDIPTSYKYRTFINYKLQYVIENLITFEEEMETYGDDW